MTFDPFQHRVQLFTGKGGVGKSSVIAALALTAAEEGHRPLIVELSHRATFGALFGEDLGYEPREVAPGVFATHVRDEDAVHDYVLERVKLRGVARRIVEQPALARFFEAAPAVAEVATLHRLTRLADAGAYHPIFVDLDATGHALMFLELPRVFEGLTGAGPLRALLERATALLHDGERTILHLVTLPAELPARETRQLHAALVGSSEDRASRAASGAGTVALGALFVNRVPREPLSAAEAALVEGRPGEVCEEDLALARRAQREHAAALEQLSRLTRELGLPSVGLPEVPALRRAVDLASLAVLGRAAVGQLRAGAGAGAGVGVGVGAGFEAGSASGSGSEAGSEARSEAGGGSEVASRSEVASGSGSASASGAGAGAESGAGAELGSVGRGRGRGTGRGVGAIDDLLDARRLLVCVGPGGVGKTTTAAALALRAARRGRRALVLTIDPAKRLADALGLDGLDDHVQRVEGVGPGSLDAAMLDTKASYDALISRVATGEARERILGNRVYAAFSRTLARSHAYVAAERLYDVLHGDHYDLVVLDTPPTRSALEILDAPSRLVRFLDQDVLRYFLEDRGGIAGGFASLARLGGAAALKLLGRLAGESLVRELLAFFEALSHLREGFQTRAELTSAALRDPRTAYVLVTSPTPMSLDDAAHLAGQLAERHLPPALVLYNRAFVDAPASTGASCVPLPELRAEIGDAREDALALARAFSEAHAPAARALAIAEREGDLHTVADLDELLTVVTPVE